MSGIDVHFLLQWIPGLGAAGALTLAALVLRAARRQRTPSRPTG